MAVALYARVSTTKQAEKDLSIPDQLGQMRDWCARHGYSVAREYVEPGASATDDRRPVFQKMIVEATEVSPAPFTAIIVHSQSRFFRNAVDFGLYERSLTRAGVELISMTQPRSEDPGGGMMRQLFSVFDEYQSAENSKHTLRAMKENARQGFFNGSRPPFGYRVVDTVLPGRRGVKKRIEVDPTEAHVVRMIFDVYLSGHEGIEVGLKSVAELLNNRGLRYRSAPWNRMLVHQVLSNPVYTGKAIFNQRNNKTGKLKPPDEWIITEVEPIIESGVFAGVRSRAAARAPAKVPPRLLSSRTLLTGLLTCGECGAGMTLATGKGGRYRYYKCNNRINGQGVQCASKAVPVAKLDAAVLGAVADKVFTPSRVKALLTELRKTMTMGRTKEDEELARLKREIDATETALNRIYEAFEKGLIPMDETLQARAQTHKGRKEALLIEMAGLRRKQELPLSSIQPSKVGDFCAALRNVLLGKNQAFAKQYLKALVSEVRMLGDRVTITGSRVALAYAVSGSGAAGAKVPSSVPNWLPDLDSNQGHTD